MDYSVSTIGVDFKVRTLFPHLLAGDSIVIKFVTTIEEKIRELKDNP